VTRPAPRSQSARPTPYHRRVMISIVMPAHNEQGYLEPAVKSVVAGIRDRELLFELLVAENGSIDATGEEAKSLARTYPEVRVLRAPVADYGRALKTGFLAASGDIVINFDVDFVDLLFLDRALDLMATGDPAIVVGSKRSPGADDQRRAGRKTVTAVFSLVLRKGFGLKVTDTHGLKALRRAALLRLVETCQFGGDIFDTELILRAERSGLTVLEVPVAVTDQRPPRTSITRRIPRSLVGLVRLRLALRHRDPAGLG
jgi:glycosyltransferase involved in cell wall biosynthesis